MRNFKAVFASKHALADKEFQGLIEANEGALLTRLHTMKSPSPTANSDPSRGKQIPLLTIKVLLVIKGNTNVNQVFPSQMLARESFVAHHTRALKYTGNSDIQWANVFKVH